MPPLAVTTHCCCMTIGLDTTEGVWQGARRCRSRARLGGGAGRRIRAWVGRCPIKSGRNVRIGPRTQHLLEVCRYVDLDPGATGEAR